MTFRRSLSQKGSRHGAPSGPRMQRSLTVTSRATARAGASEECQTLWLLAAGAVAACGLAGCGPRHLSLGLALQAADPELLG